MPKPSSWSGVTPSAFAIASKHQARAHVTSRKKVGSNMSTLVCCGSHGRLPRHSTLIASFHSTLSSPSQGGRSDADVVPSRDGPRSSKVRRVPYLRNHHRPGAPLEWSGAPPDPTRRCSAAWEYSAVAVGGYHDVPSLVCVDMVQTVREVQRDLQYQFHTDARHTQTGIARTACRMSSW